MTHAITVPASAYPTPSRWSTALPSSVPAWPAVPKSSESQSWTIGEPEDKLSSFIIHKLILDNATIFRLTSPRNLFRVLLLLGLFFSLFPLFFIDFTLFPVEPDNSESTAKHLKRTAKQPSNSSSSSNFWTSLRKLSRSTSQNDNDKLSDKSRVSRFPSVQILTTSQSACNFSLEICDISSWSLTLVYVSCVTRKQRLLVCLMESDFTAF